MELRVYYLSKQIVSVSTQDELSASDTYICNGQTSYLGKYTVLDQIQDVRKTAITHETLNELGVNIAAPQDTRLCNKLLQQGVNITVKKYRLDKCDVPLAIACRLEHLRFSV